MSLAVAPVLIHQAVSREVLLKAWELELPL